MRVYLSGKITGNRTYKEDFTVARNEIESQYNKAVIIDPSKLDEVLPNGGYEDYLQMCEIMLKSCDMIYMLSNYKDSKGAMYELGLAKGLGKLVLFRDDFMQAMNEEQN